mmetsp:Transcript_1835/g.3691  ORF Transcript_1835/g.3691 Transcript_1835/m.3691 type:complete len:670 (+) Transcript_1835:98-2107(+)
MSQLHFLVVVLTLLASPPSWAFESLLHPEPIPAPNLNNCTEANLVWGIKKGGMALQSLPAECTTLDLSNTRIGDGKAEALAAALKLPGAPTLEVLKLQRNSIGDAGLTALAPLLVRIPVVHLSSNDIGDEGASALADALRRALAADALLSPGLGHQNNKLVELHLANNAMGSEGCGEVAKAVAGNPVLEVLVLSFNDLETEGAMALAAGVRGKGSSLRDLRLTRCRVGDAGANALGLALGSESCMLERLELGMNGIGDQGAKGIAKGLVNNHKLKALFLTGHPPSLRNTDEDHAGTVLGDEGCTAIARAIAKNPHTALEELDLSRGSVGDKGAGGLGRMLRVDDKLRILKLQDNLVGDAGAVHLAGGLEGHGMLEELHLRNNNVHDEGAARLWMALRRNPQIHQFVLYDNMIAGTVMDRIRETLHRDDHSRMRDAEIEAELAAADADRRRTTTQHSSSSSSDDHPAAEATLALQQRRKLHGEHPDGGGGGGQAAARQRRKEERRKRGNPVHLPGMHMVGNTMAAVGGGEESEHHQPYFDGEDEDEDDEEDEDAYEDEYEDEGDSGGGAAIRRGLEAIYDMLDGCELATLFPAVHQGLGVDHPNDLQHIEFADLHGNLGRAVASEEAQEDGHEDGESVSLTPMQRTELVECVCEGEFKDIAESLCGRNEL